MINVKVQQQYFLTMYMINYSTNDCVINYITKYSSSKELYYVLFKTREGIWLIWIELW